MTARDAAAATDTIFFRPWVGDSYATTALGGVRVLILGESHYGSGHEEANPEFTDIVVRGHLVQSTRFPLFGKVEALLTGGPLHDPDARTAFWQSVIFCNLVQRLMPKLQHRPTRADWATAKASFVPVLRRYRPDAVLVLGVGTWNALSGADFMPSRSIDSGRTPALRAWEIEVGHTCVATWVVHPTGARGPHRFRVADWQGRTSELMARANAIVQDRA